MMENRDAYIKMCHKLAGQFNQDAILVVSKKEGVLFIDSAGNINKLGGIRNSTSTLGKYYSKIKGRYWKFDELSEGVEIFEETSQFDDMICSIIWARLRENKELYD